MYTGASLLCVHLHAGYLKTILYITPIKLESFVHTARRIHRIFQFIANLHTRSEIHKDAPGIKSRR